MLKITMFSSAETVPGQGVGSAYRELVNLLTDKFTQQMQLKFNSLKRADISHYHTIDFWFYLNTFLPGRGRKIGYVHFLPETLEGSITLHAPVKNIFYWYVMAFYKRMDHIVVVNPTFIDKLVANGVAREKISYIPNFVSKTRFYPESQAEKAAFRQKKGYQPSDYIVLGVGQIQERKGVFDFIELAKANPEWSFIWTGGFSFGSITSGYDELKKVVDNPPANLYFPGIVDRDEMNAYYNMADTFLLPSFNELFPMSALEAFSTGTPTILRDLTLYQAIIAGYYLPASDRAAMQKQLEALNGDPDLRTTMIQAALEASERYSAENVAKIWEKFYFEQANAGR
ncbi:glycosyltransferase family 4 protein [Weissella diestrammenae]|uniref:glycosyltransferase family 4 protein n=1 Tax=Weissella diestrammenae TaxID=1162633 RepID=UPI00196012AB|nr:glycosyltransferase family 4 protein [Weissella diestrammenae]MCM0583050.1 glycosyltransferase family 4 protein [Weissella diestrammenae]